MTPDDNFAKKITTYLDHGTADLKAGTAYRLQLARAEALARLADPQRAPATRVAVAGGGQRLRNRERRPRSSGRAAGSGSGSH